jgi:hypothetical protein
MVLMAVPSTYSAPPRLTIVPLAVPPGSSICWPPVLIIVPLAVPKTNW